MKKVKLICIVILFMFCALIFSACETGPIAQKAEKIELSETDITLLLGEIALIDVKISPENVTIKDFDIVGGNSNVATVTADQETMRIVVEATDEVVGGVRDTFIGVRTTDGSYKEAHLNIHVLEDDQSVDTPKNLTFDGKRLVWQEISEANGYTVCINDQTRVIYTNSFELDLDEIAGQEMVAMVKSNGASRNLDSPYTSELRFTVLNAPKNLSFDDETKTVSWDAVENATSYAVSVNGRLLSSTTTSLDISNSIVDVDRYQISVRANGDNAGTYINSAFSKSILLSKLTFPETLNISNGVATWGSVIGAVKYEVSCSYYKDGELIEETETTKTTSYFLPFDIDAGTGKIKIMAIGNGKTTISSDYCVERYFVKLARVKNLRVENGVILWDAVQYATSYTIRFENMLDENGELKTIQIADTSALTYELPEFLSGDYQINIQANGSTGNVSSNFLQSPLLVNKLKMTTHLQATKIDNDCVVRWANNPNAQGWEIHLNNSETKTYNITATEGEFVEYTFSSSVIEVGINLISVKALGSSATESTTFVNSDLSDEITVIKLKVPTIYMDSIKTGVISWLNVGGAGHYEVEVKSLSGALIDTYNLTTNRIDFNSTDYKLDVGSYQIKIRAVSALNSINFDGEYCDTIKITKLSTNNVRVKNGTVNDIVPQGNYKYDYIITRENGSVERYASVNDFVEKAIKSNEKVAIQVQANSIKIKDDADMYFISSDLSQKLYVKKLPTIDDISMTKGELFYGSAYRNLSGYNFSLKLKDYSGGQTTDLPNETNTSYNFKMISAGEYEVVISAVSSQNGDGLSENENNPLNLNSYNSKAFSFEKLFAPNNFEVSYFANGSTISSFVDIIENTTSFSEKDSGSLTWQSVGNATEYELIFDNNDSESTNIKTTKSYESLQNTYITRGNHTATIRALGNGANIIDSEKSNTIVEFTKYVAPSTLSLEDGILSWSYANEEDDPNRQISLTSYTSNAALYLIVDTNNDCYSTLSDDDYSSYENLIMAFKRNSCEVPKELIYSTTIRIVAVPLNAYITGLFDLSIGPVRPDSRCIISDFSPSLNIEPLITPFDLKMENNVISWTPLRYETALKEYKLTFSYEGNLASKNSFIIKKGASSIDTVNKIVYVEDLISTEGCSWRFNKQNFEEMFGEGSYLSGNYQVTVQAIANNVSYYIGEKQIYYINSPTSTSKKIEVLESPIVYLSYGKIVWSKVENVSGYWLYVNQIQDGTDYEVLEPEDVESQDSNLCSYNFGKIYDPGTYYFNLIAIGDGANTVTSEFREENEKEFIKLEKMTGLRIENGLIAYDEHDIIKRQDNGCVYIIRIQGNFTETNKTTYFPANIIGGRQYEIYVYARGDNQKYISSDETGPCYVGESNRTLPTKFEEPSGITIRNGKLYWDRINGVTEYRVTISGQVPVATIDTTYDLSDIAGGTYSISIQAMGNDYYINSDIATKRFKKLPEITDLRLENGYITWNYSADSFVQNDEEDSQQNVSEEYYYRIVIDAEDEDDRQEIQLTAENSEIIEVFDGSSLIAKNIRYYLKGFESGVYPIYIYNFGGSKYISSSISETIFYEKLPKLVNDDLLVKNENILIKEVENASNYIINFTVYHADNMDGSTYEYIPANKNDLVLNGDGYRTLKFNDIKNEALAQLHIVSSDVDHYGISVIVLGSTYGSVYAHEQDESPIYYVASDESGKIMISQSPTPELSYETYEFTFSNNTKEDRFAGRIVWSYASEQVSSAINYYKVYVKAIDPAHSVLFGYDLSEGKVDSSYPDFKYYEVRGRLHANVIYSDTYEFFVVACQDKNGFDSEKSQTIDGLTYNLFASSEIGSLDNPFRITSELQFKAIKFNLDANYVLTKDMQLSSVPDSFGSENMPFFGSFDGQNHTISGVSGALLINSRNTTFRGLFGYIGESGVVKNFVFNAQINALTGRDVYKIEMAGISTHNYGKIINVEMIGTISSILNSQETTISNAGITIYNYGTISRALSKVVVEPKNNKNNVYAGGVVVYNYGTVEKSGFVGRAYGQIVGGIVAQNSGIVDQCYYSYNSAYSTIIESQNKGTSINIAGGIVGYNTNGGTISYCYTTAGVNGSTNSSEQVFVGGIVGYIDDGRIEKCYVVACDSSKNPIITASSQENLSLAKVGVFVGGNFAIGSISGGGLICIRASEDQSFAGSGALTATAVTSIKDTLTNADLNDKGYFDDSKTYPTLINAKY